MPELPQKPCRNPLCPNTTSRGGYCEKCRPPRRESNRKRPSAARRGYGRKWRESTRRNKLAKDPLCERCSAPEAPVEAEEVHHKDGNPRNNRWENLESLCKSCHSRETKGAQEGPSKGLETPAELLASPLEGDRRATERAPVTLICGPPGAGKTSLVMARRRHGDLVLDLDRLVLALTGLPMFEKPAAVMPFAWEARDAILAKLELPSHLTRAWIVTMGAKREPRARLRERLGADVVIVKPSPLVCITRIQEDPRRKGVWKAWEKIVRKWYRDYEPGEGETVLTDAVQ